ISRYASEKRPDALVIFSSLASGATCLLIFLLAPVKSISALQSFGGIFAGMLFIAGYIPYMHALQKEEVSITAPLWQMVVPISYILGAVVLHEYLSGRQMLAGFLIMAGAV